MTGDSRSGKPEKGPPAFLKKTYDMVDEVATNDIVSWSRKGKTFVVWKDAEFLLLLPKYFNHCNFASFVRQLNTYGFRKVVGGEAWEFSNEGFQRGQKHLLRGIQRRAPEKQSTGSDQEAEIERLRQENSDLLQEVDKLKGEIQKLVENVQALERKNCRMPQFTKNIPQVSTPEAESSQSNSSHFDLQSMDLTESVNRVDSSELYTSVTSLKSSCLKLLPSPSFEPPVPNSPHQDQIPGLTQIVNGADSPEPYTSEASAKSSCLDLLLSPPCEPPRLGSTDKDLRILGLTEMGNQIDSPELCTSGGSVKSSCLDLLLRPPCQHPPIRKTLCFPTTVGSTGLTNRATTTPSSEEIETEMKNEVYWEQLLTETPDTPQCLHLNKKLKKSQ